MKWTVEAIKNDWNWQQAFDYATYPIEDIVEVIAADEGENEGANWIGIFKYTNGKYSVLRAGCDFTGWDCQASGTDEVYNTLEEAISPITITEEERERFRL